MRYLITVGCVVVAVFVGYALVSTVHTVVRANEKIDQMMARYAQ